MSWKKLAIGCWVLASSWSLGGYAALAEAPQMLYEEGLRALEGQRILQAEQLFERCLELDSTFCDAYVSLARLYLSRNSLDQADSLLAAAMRQQPRRVEAPFEYSKLLSRQGRLEEAYAQLKKVVELEPRTAAAYMGIGHLRMAPNQMMDLREAGEAFAKVYQLEPQNHEAIFNLGQVRLYQGDWDAAIAAFQNLLAQRPENLSSRYQLGMAFYLKGGYPEAAAELRRAVELAPRWLIARWALYLAYKHLGGYPADLPDSCQMKLATPTGPGEVGVRFAEVAAQAGVGRLDLGRGSAWADGDGDGDLDLFTMGHSAGNALYRNDGGVFTDQTEEAGVEGKSGMGCVFADYDNDGDPDLYLTRDGWYGRAPNTLFQNDGKGRFADVSARAGVDDEGSSSTACWGDVDNDGNLDLLVANGVTGDKTPNRLFRSNGQGGFADIAAAAGIRPDRSVGSAFGDYDNDGDLDLYIANFNSVNAFYRNDTDSQTGEVVFAEATRETRTHLPLGGYYTFFFDYDNDGYLDLFCSEMSDYEAVLYSKTHGHTRLDRNRPALYHNERDGSFADMTYQAGLGKSFGSTGVHCGDFDGDGYPDIYLANGGAEMTRLEPDALLLNRRDGTFVDIAPAIGLEQLGKGHGVSFADYDGDGDQDIYVPVGGTYPGDLWQSCLFRNDTPGQHWLILRLVGVRSNRDGIGARVRVQAGGRTQYAEVSSGGGFGVTNSLQVEMGLGGAEKVEALEVHWPSGQVDTHGDLAVNQVLVVREGEVPR